MIIAGRKVTVIDMEEKNEMQVDKKAKVKGVMTEDEVRKRKTRKTKTSISVFLLLLAVGVGGNWYWENSDISSKISSVTSSTKTLGEATYVDAPTEVTTAAANDYFSSARIERQNSRDASLENLQKIIDSTEESDEARKTAAESVAAISSYIEIENKIETLVQAKGVNNCLAVVNDDGTRVDVIVDVQELTDEVILQIKEIATQQLNCGFENVTIIQSN